MNSLLDELGKILCVKFTAYADDLILLVSVNDLDNLETKLNDSFKIIDKWCKRTELKLNLDKTKFMLLKKRKLSRDIVLNGRKLNLVDKVKYLGIVIDKNLTWYAHIDYLDEKINKLIGRLNFFAFIKSDLELSYKRRLYFSVFVPTISYAANIWFPYVKDKPSYISKLITMQNRVIRSLFKTYRCTSTVRLLKLLNIVSINYELHISLGLDKLDYVTRSLTKADKRSRFIEQIVCDYPIEIAFEDVLNFTNRFTLWCLLGTGPFKEFLYKINKTSDPYCRYCNLDIENFYHFYYICEKFRNFIVNSSSFEDICKHIVITLHKDVFLLN